MLRVLTIDGRRGAIGLSIILLFTTFAIGGVHPWSSALMELGVWVLALLWFLSRSTSRQRNDRPARFFVFSAAALVLYLLFQLTPLPPGLLATLSPSTAELYQRTLGTLAKLPLREEPIGSVGTVEDARVSPAQRERIRALAEKSGGTTGTAWRPIAVYPSAARSDLLRYLAFGLVLWLAATVPVPRLLLRATLTIGVAVATVALVQFIAWTGHILWLFTPYDTGPLGEQRRMTGPFVNPDHLAMFLAVLVPIAAALISSLRAEVRVRRFRGNDDPGSNTLRMTLLALALATMIAVLLGSASRGGIVGAMLGAVVFWWGARTHAMTLRPSVRLRGRPAWVQQLVDASHRYAPAALAVLIILGGLTYAGPQAREVLDQRITGAFLSPDLNIRTTIWAQTLPMAKDFPVFGVGAGCWRELFRRYRRYPELGYQPNHAHNDYLEWLTEVGGLGLALTIVVAAAFVMWARSNRSIPPPIRWGLLGGVVAVGWQETVDFGLRIPANALLLSVVLGLLCNPHWASKRERTRPDGVEPSWALVVPAAAVAVVLASFSFRQLQEFFQWSSVRNGSPNLELASRNGDTWHKLGVVLYRLGFRYLPPTERCFRTAASAQPTLQHSYWWASRAATKFATKVDLLESALYLDPTHTTWRLSYATFLDMLGREKDAIAQLEEAVYFDPRLSSHSYLDSKTKPGNEVLFRVAERGFLRALERRRDDAALLHQVAAFYDRFQEWAKAADLWLEAADLSGDWATYGSRAASALAHAENYEQAERVAKRVIREDPGRAEWYRLLAIEVYRPQKKYEDAKQILTVGTARTREASLCYTALAELAGETGDVKSSLQAWEQAASLRQQDPGLQFRLGLEYLKQNDYHRAKIAFNRALTIDPDKAAYHYHLGVALERLYDLGAARQAYRKAVQLDTRNPVYAKSLNAIEGAFEQKNAPSPGTD